MGWKKTHLSELASFRNGKKRPSIKGNIPVYGGNGILDYAGQNNFENCISIGRVGAYCGNVFLSNSKCWISDNAIAALPKENISLFFLYYLLKNLQLNKMCIGSGQPLLTQGILKSIEVSIPDAYNQRKIGCILSVIDDKIALNQQINKNLEEQAQAIFKAWFVDFEPWHGDRPNSWEEGVLGDYVEIKRGGSPRPIQDYLVDSGLRWLKISDVTALQSPFIIDIKEHIKEDGLNKTVFLKAGALVLSNSATPGIPKILDVDSCIHDGWLYFPESKLPNVFLYLLFKFIRKDLVQLGNGSVFTNLKTDILKNYPFSMPDNNTLSMFDDIVTPLFQSMNNIARENKRLSNLRDALLPRLMSGEIDVSGIEV